MQAGTTVVLNGTTSSGKTTLALALRELWPGPLQVSGIDSFLALQSASFFGLDGTPAPGLTWTVTDGGGAPTCTITPGPLGDAMVRCAHAYWAACAAAGLDQVVDDVWLTREWAAGLRAALAGRPVLWVGVVCPLDVLEAREAARGDRVAGQARGQLDVVHQGSSYDVTVDTSLLTPGEAAGVVLDAAKRLPGPSSRG